MPTDIVLNLISNYKRSSSGFGGHYYTIKAITKELNRHTRSMIYSLGDFPPGALLDDQNHTHIPCSLFNQHQAISIILKNLEAHKITVIHGYDAATAYVGRVLSLKLKVPFYLTKCGGPFPKIYYPNVKTTIVFHQTDLDALKKKCSNRNTVILLPNRVEPFLPSQHRKKLPKKLDGSELNVVRIGKIGRTYFQSILQTINLATTLQALGLNPRTYIIGVIDDQNAYMHLLARTKELEEVTFVTHEEATRNAKDYLPDADLVIGTGRGALEALSLGKPLFFPTKNTEIPCFCTIDNIKIAADNNFSQRTIISEISANKSLEIFLELIKSSREEQEAYRMDMISYFKKHYAVEEGVKTLLRLYNREDNHKQIVSLSALPDLALQRAYLLGLSFYNKFR